VMEELVERGEVKLALRKCGSIVSQELRQYFEERYGRDVEVRFELVEGEEGPRLRYGVVRTVR